MKIIFVNTLYYPNMVGGAERSVQSLSEALVKEGDHAVVITTIAGSETIVDYVNGVKVYYIGIKNLYWQYDKSASNKYTKILKPIWHAIDIYNPWMATEVERILDAEQPDLVHTNNLAGFSVAIWQIVKKRKISLVHTLRDYYLICPRKYIMFRNDKSCEAPCWDCKIYSLPKQQVSNLVDAVIGISNFILKSHLNLNYFTQVPVKKVIYNSYKATANLKNSSYCLRLGYLGRLENIKGFDLLLKTLAKLSSNNWELQIGGEVTSEQIASYRSLYPLSNVYYLGYVKPEVFFSKIDVLIVPSLWQEPLGRIVLEAYAHGVPVIGSNRGGIPEIIDVNKTGFVFDPFQENSLLEIVEKVVNNPTLVKEISENALQKSEYFTPSRILQAYSDVYQTVIR